MANQANFSEPIESQAGNRPFRHKAVDEALIKGGEKTVLFGTTDRDCCEIWIYNLDGTLAAQTRISVTDPVLTLSSVVDNTGAHEFLNIDIDSVAAKLGLSPGRYGMSVYFLRDEVGGLEKYKMFIDEISPSRTELRIKPIEVTDEVKKDVYEFVVPSVPKIYAQAITTQIFGKNLDQVPGEEITIPEISVRLKAHIQNTTDRITMANMQREYEDSVKMIETLAYFKVIQKLIESQDLNVQHTELQTMLFESIDEAVKELEDRNAFDFRFGVVTNAPLPNPTSPGTSPSSPSAGSPGTSTSSSTPNPLSGAVFSKYREIVARIEASPPYPSHRPDKTVLDPATGQYTKFLWDGVSWISYSRENAHVLSFNELKRRFKNKWGVDFPDFENGFEIAAASSLLISDLHFGLSRFPEEERSELIQNILDLITEDDKQTLTRFNQNFRDLNNAWLMGYKPGVGVRSVALTEEQVQKEVGYIPPFTW